MEERVVNQVGKIMEILHHSLPEDYEYNFIDDNANSLSKSSPNHEETTFRMKLTTNNEIKRWMNDLQDKCRTTWRVQQTFPNSGRVNLFKISYRCHHNTDKRKRSAGVKPKHSKDTNCPAKIKIVVKRYVKNSKGKRPDALTKEWPCIVSFNNKHNHELQSASVLKHRDMSEETRQKLLYLFQQGHSATSALRCLKTDLYIEHPDDHALYECDGRYVPSLSVCWHLFNKEFKQQYGSRSGEQMLTDLKKFLEEYSASTSGKAISGTTDGGHSYVCVCTPLMARAHIMIKESSEVVYVDAVSSLGRQRHRVFFITTTTPAGGLPLGIIICEAEKDAVFACALKDLIENCLPEKSFYGQKYPSIIITDVDWKERLPLQENFAASAHLLCQFHVLKAMWSWLCKTTKHGNGIEKSDCQELFYLFKSLVYSRTEDDLLLACNQLMCESEVAKKYPQYIKYVEKFWQEKEAWASCYRSGFPASPNNTTNYLEVSFRMSKDSILDKVVAFNLTQLVDFFVTRYESYVEKRLVSFCEGRLQKSLFSRKSNIPLDDIWEYESETRSDCFTVPSETEKSISYTVDISRGICECVHGNASSPCKHISAVFEKLKRDSIYVAGESTLLTRIIMYQVATGKEPDRECLLSLSSEVPEAPEEIQVHVVPDVETTQSQQSPSQEQKVSEIKPSVGEPMTYVELFVASPEEKENTGNHLTSMLDLALKEKAQDHMKKLYDRVMQGVEKNPLVYIPAITEMGRMEKKYASSEAGLVTALRTLAKCLGKKNLPKKNRVEKNRVAAVKRKIVSARRIAPKLTKNKQDDHDYTM